MKKKSLKDILLDPKSNYETITGHIITSEDIMDFYNLYLEISDLEKEYEKTVYGRKNEALKIREKLMLLANMNNLFEKNLKAKVQNYEIATKNIEDVRVKEHYKMLEVLKELASNDEVKYVVKTFNFPAVSFSENNGYRYSYDIMGQLIILAEEKALEKLGSSEHLTHLRRSMLEDIYNQGFSMVLAGTNEHLTENLNIENKRMLGVYQPLVFYLQNDELSKAAYSLMLFINDNGADFSNLEVTDIVKAINEKYIVRSKKRS